MILENKIIKEKYPRFRRLSYFTFFVVLVLTMFAGCRTIPTDKKATSKSVKKQVFILEHISSERCITLLSQLGISEVSKLSKANLILAAGSTEQLQKASIVLRFIDTKENFVIHNLGPASMVRSLPSNRQIAAALGDIMIGTFTNPPSAVDRTKGIIDGCYCIPF